MENAGLKPVSMHEVAEELDIKSNALNAFMRRLAGTGFVIQISQNRFLLPEAIQDLAAMAELLANQKELTAAGFRNKSGIGRNMTIEILEFFDKAGFTKREGNTRHIVKPAAGLF